MKVRARLAGNLSGLYVIAIGLIALVYLLQLFSPLRLNTDATTLLSMASNANDGRGFTEQGHATQFPLGFPLILLALIKMHLARSAVLVALNICCLAIASWQFAIIASRHWGLRADQIALIIIAFLLSFPTIKHVTVPLTEMPFAAAMMMTLRCMVGCMVERNIEPGRRWRLLILALMLTLCSIFIRTLGIALLPALLWCVVADPAVRTWLLSTRRRPVIALGILAVFMLLASVAVFLVTRTRYFHYFISRSSDPATLVRTALIGRLSDSTELFCNLPVGKLGHLPWLLAFGVIPIALVFTGLVAMKKCSPVEVFLAGYAAILTVWPYQDSRFWIPVLPFAIVLIFKSFELIRIVGLGQFVKHAYVALFCVAGVAALGYSTRLSLSGDHFADLYGTPATRATYQSAFRRPFDPSVGLYRDQINLLKRYEPRARQKSGFMQNDG